MSSHGPTAWYITSITSADKSDVISFTYTDPVFVRTRQAYKSLTVVDNPTQSLAGNMKYSPGSSTSDHMAIHVKDIIFKNGQVSFNYVPDRQDVLNENRLSAVKIFQNKDGAQTEIKRFSFVQSYFVATSGQKSQLDDIQNPPGFNEKNKRLRLDALYEQGFKDDQIITKPSYTFTYEDGGFPAYGTTAQDFMGYYNGAHGNGNLLFYDYGEGVLGPEISQSHGANRKTDPSQIDAGVLKRIDFPTGGYTAFEVEPNQVRFVDTIMVPDKVSNRYTLTTRNLARNDTTFTLTLPPEADPSTLVGYFSVSAKNDIELEDIKKISTSISLFDETTHALAEIRPVVGPTTPGAIFGLPAESKGLTATMELVLYPNHTYTLSYGTTVPVTNNFIYTSVWWEASKGMVPKNIDEIYYTGGLRIKSIVTDDGEGNVQKKKYAYTKWYYNSNLFNGDVGQMADVFKSKCFRWYKYAGEAQPTHAWFDTYGENVTFDLGSSNNTTASYEEVEEYQVDLQDHPLGKTVTTFNRAIDQISSWSPSYRTDEEWKRGQVLSQKVYRSGPSVSFELLKETIYEYDYKPMFTIEYNSSVLWQEANIFVDIQMLYQECILPKLNIYKYSHILQDIFKSDLIKTTTIDYDQNGEAGGNAKTTVESFVYDQTKHYQLVRTIKQTSDSRELTKNLKYALDYTVATCDEQPCYAAFNGQVDQLLTEKKACESQNFENYVIYRNSDYPLANTYFDAYLECANTFHTAVVNELSTLNSCKADYASCVTSFINGSASDKDKALLILQQNNVVNTLIDATEGVLENGTEYMRYGVRTDFKPAPYAGVAVPDVIWAFGQTSKVTKDAVELNPTPYYRKVGTFSKYDNRNNLTQRSKDSDVISSFIWDYDSQYPIAEAVNATVDDIAFTSFEADGTGNWTIPSSARYSEARTGMKCYDIVNGSIRKTGVVQGRNYVVSFWAKTNSNVLVNGASASPSGPEINAWQYYEVKIIGSATVTDIVISGTGYIDELRLAPANALMTTYTYEPLVGVRSVTDPNNQSVFYEYDASQRLKLVRDSKLNLVKTYTYHYAGQN
ncbi:MAG TPA: hypothetical protein VIU12_31530 [Chryseolinea sp.]